MDVTVVLWVMGFAIGGALSVAGWGLRETHRLGVEVAVLRERDLACVQRRDGYENQIGREIKELKCEVTRVEERIGARVNESEQRLTAGLNVLTARLDRRNGVNLEE